MNEIEVKLERLKKFNKKLNNRNAQAVPDKVEFDKTKYVLKADKNVGTNGSDDTMVVNTKDGNIFDMNENGSTESCVESENDDEVSATDYKKEAVDVNVLETVENAVIRSINDKEYQTEVKEFNDWYYSKLDEKLDKRRYTKGYKKIH